MYYKQRFGQTRSHLNLKTVVLKIGEHYKDIITHAHHGIKVEQDYRAKESAEILEDKVR